MAASKACVVCNGCPESAIDSARLRRYLEENGWLVTEDHTTADLVLFNACALTEKKTNDSLKIIKKLQGEKKKGSQVIVCGCLSKIDLETLKQVYNGPSFSEKEFTLLDQVIGASKPIEDVTVNCVIPRYRLKESRGLLIDLLQPVRKYESYLESKFNLFAENDPSIFYIKVATGCLGNCAYCGIRKSRGTIRSKPIEKIVCEFREGLSRGFKYFSLLGTDLGAYGRDLGYNLADLLEEMIKEKGDYNIALRNVNPYYLRKMLDKLAPIFASGRIWYLSCAAESGSNRILKLMRRNYTIEEYKECIQAINRVRPDIILRTQLMVGFPTETEQDFVDSMRLLDDVAFDFVEVYKFSRRPGTLAAKMEGQVPEQIKEQRIRKLYAKALLNRTPRKIKRVLQSYISKSSH